MSLRMKPRPGYVEGLWRKFRDFFPARPGRSFDLLLDKWLVRTGWVPEMTDGTGKILHISDTPTCMYGYLARFLRRVNPSVIVHTGDLADDIKLAIYPAEAERYRSAARHITDIMLAPRRKVMDVTLYGERFRISHYFESVLDSPAKYNLFGHSMETPSFSDDKERCFLNGLEMMRLIDTDTGITIFNYPKTANDARLARRNRKGP